MNCMLIVFHRAALLILLAFCFVFLLPARVKLQNQLVGTKPKASSSVVAKANFSNTCHWFSNVHSARTWGDEAEFSKLLQVAGDEAPKLFAGKRVLFIGGSTSRDHAPYFYKMVLERKERELVDWKWNNSSVEGKDLFPREKKLELDFDKMYEPRVMQPLLQSGWRFEHLMGQPTAGCMQCKVPMTNFDHEGRLKVGHKRDDEGEDEEIRFEYSWKPEIFLEGDDVKGFEQKYCQEKYDVVHIGRGLHDAFFYMFKDLTAAAIKARFLKLEKLLRCFPQSTLLVIRTPYRGSRKRSRKVHGGAEETILIRITEILHELFDEGAFDTNHTILLDGHHMSSQIGSPDPVDGHHYPPGMIESYMSVFALAAKLFFDRGSFPPDLRLGNHCGIRI